MTRSTSGARGRKRRAANSPPPPDTAAAPPDASATAASEDVATLPLTFEDGLLDRVREQWQQGDWDSLMRLDIGIIERHPERARLALAVASACQQVHAHAAARRFVRLAQDWGCERKLLARVLISGVHNTLARSAALLRQEQRALDHFREAVAAARGSASLATYARAANELKRLGLAPGPLAGASPFVPTAGTLPLAGRGPGAAEGKQGTGAS
jgi:hypothetical protein